jgi:uncharacterized protein YecT (DUF1311 family)
MIRFVAVLSLVFGASTSPVVPSLAASFDCTRASTPFEHAICDNPELSTADERLSRSYATANGGLTEAAAETMRVDQREWLNYAQRACAAEAAPMRSGEYDDTGVSCLVDLFKTRSRVLESSRMMDGLRFYPISSYDALPDPEAEADSAWATATHELDTVQLDEELGFANAFNDLVRGEGEAMQGGAETVVNDAGSDSSNSIRVKEVAGEGRITLEANTYWYGHGAAHGNYTITYLHFLTGEERFMEPGDLFTGKKWRQALLDLAVEALQEEHGEMLMLDGTEYIEEPVADPRRWDLSNPYGLVIQFEPYEVSAYAYGAPTATVSWEDLAPYLAEGADSVRYGF